MEPPQDAGLIWKAVALVITSLSSSGVTVWLVGKKQGKQETERASQLIDHEKRIIELEETRIVTADECNNRHSGCKDLQAVQLAHGSDEFKEIKRLIAKMDEANQQRHDLILGHLLRSNGKD